MGATKVELVVAVVEDIEDVGHMVVLDEDGDIREGDGDSSPTKNPMKRIICSKNMYD